MKPTFVVALGAVLCLGSTAAAAQEGDDWEFAADPARNLSVAAVRFDAGVSIVVQCRERALSTLLIGMPPGTGPLEVQATRADGRADAQTWAPGPAPGIMLSTVAPRDARFMRGGGQYSVRTVDDAPRALRTEFDLPAQSANLDRVLAACGWGATDERDQLARAGDAISLSDPEAQRRRPPTVSRSVSQRRRPPPPPPPGAPSGPPAAELQISCIVRNLHLTECRPHHPASPGQRVDISEMRRYEGREVFATGDDPAEGRVVYLHGGGVVTIEYIGMAPAR